MRTTVSDEELENLLPSPPDELVQLIDPEGHRLADPLYDPFVADITDEEWSALYEDLVVVRRIDTEATALQRQGELGLWPPLIGQEAAQVGSARALRADDFVFPSYRENAVAYCRGVELAQLVQVWRGTAQCGWNPYDVNMATPQIVIGAQTLHAVGYAIGCQRDSAATATVAYFGDGATTQGDVNEAMVFAASFAAPVVFFCQNNQWAISEPVGLQAQRPIAERAPGFGIPSIRVDGNDVLAVLATTRRALQRAYRGDGPTFIEAVTYRMGPHTTSDDPSRYVDPAQRAEWAAKDPIARVESFLRDQGILTQVLADSVGARADAVAAEFRRECRALPDPTALSVFHHVYAEPHGPLARQRSQQAAYLRSVGEVAE
jgi:2-oxoisovalerate dehydrogenase E1 component alpha subunit